MAQSERKSIISSDDDDDYELPSLSERVKASFKPQNILKQKVSGSENEDTKFLKFSKKSNSPQISMKLDFSGTSDSENEEQELLNFSDRIRNTPQTQFRKHHQEENSDSDEIFSNLAERLKVIHTPKFQNRGNYQETDESDSDETFSNLVERLHEIHTPMTENKKNYHVEDESDSDEIFSNLTQKMHEFRTPLSEIRRNCYKADESDSDGSFSNFVEKLCTPMSVNRKNYHDANESDSDDSFLNSARKVHAFRTPKSQKKGGRRDSILLPKISEIKSRCHSVDVSRKGTPNSLKVCHSENEKEFTALFPPETVNSTFLQYRAMYTHKLFAFFNRKIFGSQLPEDMSLIWDSTLIKTAGMCVCIRKNNAYSCSIKLSPELLSSFGRLKNTLLHEMCHAAVWVINKQCKVRHGPLWQIWASRCKMILPFVECPERCHNYEVSYRVWYHCTNCNWKKGRCRQVKKYQGAVCKRCKTPIIMTYS